MTAAMSQDFAVPSVRHSLDHIEQSRALLRFIRANAVRRQVPQQHRAQDGLGGAEDLVLRWERAGRPVIPLTHDRDGQPTATTDNLNTVLRQRGPGWDRYRLTAVRWVLEHCP